ncbi:hypothetical protein MLD38_035470 [Melastoma candidum]|uniref:Uncharacterized protein n=1 Tax=Melastoma candidum TaxID=119954 RepID=A0ACB9LGS4_9MYRT|nr:hypothetical protein MLD38_035470 [Melastoma candidum]
MPNNALRIKDLTITREIFYANNQSRSKHGKAISTSVTTKVSKAAQSGQSYVLDSLIEHKEWWSRVDRLLRIDTGCYDGFPSFRKGIHNGVVYVQPSECMLSRHLRLRESFPFTGSISRNAPNDLLS